MGFSTESALPFIITLSIIVPDDHPLLLLLYIHIKTQIPSSQETDRTLNYRTEVDPPRSIPNPEQY